MSKINKKMVTVRTGFVGFHRWPYAPDAVKFLQYRHRHVFHVRMSVEVTGDRQLEFFLLRNELDCQIEKDLAAVHTPTAYHTSSMSCETMAETLAKYFVKQYDTRVEVEVQEDDENSAVVGMIP